MYIPESGKDPIDCTRKKNLQFCFRIKHINIQDCLRECINRIEIYDRNVFITELIQRDIGALQAPPKLAHAIILVLQQASFTFLTE